MYLCVCVFIVFIMCLSCIFVVKAAFHTTWKTLPTLKSPPPPFFLSVLSRQELRVSQNCHWCPLQKDRCVTPLCVCVCAVLVYKPHAAGALYSTVTVRLDLSAGSSWTTKDKDLSLKTSALYELIKRLRIPSNWHPVWFPTQWMCVALPRPCRATLDHWGSNQPENPSITRREDRRETPTPRVIFQHTDCTQSTATGLKPCDCYSITPGAFSNFLHFESRSDRNTHNATG